MTEPSAALSPAERIRLLRAEHPNDGYLAYHAPRYLMLLKLVETHWQPGLRILDIGRSHLTDLIASSLGTRVDSLGFQPDGETASGRNFRFDLNDAQHADAWRGDIGPYDVIVMAEVIEHLHTAPALVLRFVRSLLSDRGLLVLQTPNAAALHKRVKLLLGRNPYEQLREDITDPGHFREYTRKELITLAEDNGFSVQHVIAGSYFDYRYRRHGHDRIEERPHLAIANLVVQALPPTWRPGITVLLQAT